MRSALFLAVFAVVAGRGGCDPVSPHDPYDPCEAKPCGEPCRVCPPDDADCVETMVVKGCDAKGECVADGTFTCEAPPPYDPCAGKGCGESCGLCPPESPCPTFAATACDPSGECATVGTFTCEEPPPADPCAGLACGDDCVIDPPCAPLCLMPSILGKCDPVGTCQPVVEMKCQEPPPPVDPCAGRKCGEPCSTCDPAAGACPAIAVMSWCDAVGRCGYGVPVCEPPPPADPCAGKLCGDACSTCDPATDMMCPMVMMYCDAAGACGYAYPVCTAATR